MVQLVEAMEMVRQWNREVRLVLAGHRSSEHQDIEIRTAIDRLSAFQRQRLIWISQFEGKEKSSLYDVFDVFALLSTGESFGLSYLEAWMCERPVIGARIGSTQYVIADSGNGLLVDPTDPKDIADKIVELLSDREKREGMGMRGYSKTVAQYTWEKVVDRVEALYRDLHGPKGSTNMQSAIRGDASRGAQV